MATAQQIVNCVEILDLLNDLSLRSDNEVINYAESAVQVAISRRGVSLSFVSSTDDIDEEFNTSFSEVVDSKAVEDLKVIEKRMIRSKYEKECDQVYCNVKADALDECLLILGVEKLSIEEVQKTDWKSLDEKMKKWIQVIN
ncbi:conserved hypothetical protein [Ricinus communis]|uniref:Uncharacterized protein n=1 Tax=Ricinus communis TaxID=3988 RepID=B9SQX4_RICCO|nr:conserved hypothetical protein [Ricinus communis]